MTDNLVIQFDRPVVLVGGGNVAPGHLEDLLGQGFALVAADGAADRLAEMGYIPDAIIGDFDSIGRGRDWPDSTRVVHLSEQDTTDFEKCLYSTQARCYAGLGFLGKRLDHTLASIHVLTRFARKKRVMLLDETDLIVSFVGDVEIELAARERVSVYPLAPITFRSSVGLLYPLDELKLEQGGRIGVSNEATATRIKISAKDELTPYALILDCKWRDSLLASWI